MTSANPLPMGTSATREMAATAPGGPRESAPTPNPTGLVSVTAAAEYGCVDGYLYPLPVTASNAQIQRLSPKADGISLRELPVRLPASARFTLTTKRSHGTVVQALSTSFAKHRARFIEE
jgi:hypothetical protein